ncbi:MAG: prepilin-type N-terminal cleavage/methylation domain-containing protein [Phycisphaerales bacterium JB037]
MKRANGLRRGFTLVELLVVIIIIVIIVALVFPALGGARNVARTAATETTMKEFGNAIDAYRQDNDQRAPGIFDAEEMGDPENASTYGFTAMENAVLALAGGVIETDSAPSDALNFGPTAQALADNDNYGPGGIVRRVRVSLIGNAEVSGNPGYWSPNDRIFQAQERPLSQFGAGAGLSATVADIPDVVDAWGNPMLLWVENDLGPRTITTEEDFASVDTGSGPSRFYWASNAGFLESTQLGKGAQDQTEGGGEPHSLIGGGHTDAEIATTLGGFLGSPAFPAQGDFNASGFNYQNLLPAAARGRAIMQSAGIDGYYLSTADRAGKNFSADANGLPYYGNFFLPDGTRFLKDGTPSTRDQLDGFDDIVQSFGS